MLVYVVHLRIHGLPMPSSSFGQGDKARQTEFTVYRHCLHDLKISDCIQQLHGTLAPPPRGLSDRKFAFLALFY